MNEQQQGIYREAMQQAMYKAENEKTRFDKLMGREDMQRLKNLFINPVLSAEELNEIQSIIVGSEVKLTDFAQQERYINHKFFLVICRFAARYDKAIRVNEEYVKQFKERQKLIDCLPAETELEKKFKKQKQDSLDKLIKIRAEIQKEYAVIYKESLGTFLFGMRSPLSNEGNLIKTLATERKEVFYEGNLSPVPQTQVKGGN